MARPEREESPKANLKPTISPVGGRYPSVRFLDQDGALVVDSRSIPEDNIAGSIERGKYYRVVEPSRRRGLARFGGNFNLLDQDGHFKIPEPPYKSRQRATWRASLTTGERIEFSTFRNSVLELFGVKTIPEIRDVLADPARKEQRTREAYRIIARRFGIRGSDEFIKGKIEGVKHNKRDQKDEGYYDTAVREREELASNIGKVQPFELSNTVATTSNVLDLLGLVFFSKSKQIRFEAAKILDGMDGAAAADRVRREEETARFLASPNAKFVEPDQKQDELRDPDIDAINAILDSNFYSEPSKEATLLLSRHSPDDFRCLGITRVPTRQARIARFKKPPARHLYTEIPERIIHLDGRDILAYTKIRKKSLEATLTKGKRKGTKNLRKAVEDAIGMRVVVSSMDDIPEVHDKLVKAFNTAGHSFTILEVEDSLSTGETYSAKNPGSSEKLRVINILAEIGPWLAEIQYYDHTAFIDSTAQDGVSRKEFGLNRLYDSGVPQHDFPQSIYGQPHEQVRKSRIREIRSGIRIGLFRGDLDL